MHRQMWVLVTYGDCLAPLSASMLPFSLRNIRSASDSLANWGGHDTMNDAGACDAAVLEQGWTAGTLCRQTGKLYL